MSIKLQKWDKHEFISEASGKKVTAGILEVGKSYLHKNRSWLRKIISFEEGTHVIYSEMWPTHNYPGYCSKTHFVTKCPTEATEEEIKFLLKLN